MENEGRQIEGGRRALDRRNHFNPCYKGWQRRIIPNRRSQGTRRNSV